ncbi:hypothetical protein C5B42_04985 [Candidatus Cerribacteria bacterium 'Amazon FNV 2010 28 9']|uniref:Uncharacterized protein n=1 Tax=Candidatus Cerribacteria bacterium 'Amazon FNV 2010 28 9' TaxID=2081795 RepID=A0A317JMI0_9BACT|nr:MAG: hypothetical protein C5B42_04985 [Candidatus Cerribacteria bacterium 'Amazon FNV 2010 28 9']
MKTFVLRMWSTHKKQWVIFLFLLICTSVATFIRLLPGDTHIIFPYDQARDLLYVRQLVETRHLPLVGPPSDIPGVNHGVIFYYVLAVLYWVGGWNIHVTVWVFAFVNAAALIPLYYLTRRLFSPKASVVAVLLWMGSFEAISYARWISNPVLALPLFPVFFLLLEPFFHKQKGNALALGIVLGLIIQLELVLGYLLCAVIYIFLRSSQKARQYVIFFGGILLGALPLVVSELKFHFQSLRGMVAYAGGQSGNIQATASSAFLQIIDAIGLLARNNIVGFTAPFACAMSIGFFLLLLSTWKKIQSLHSSLHFLSILMLSSLPLFLIGKKVEIFFLIGIGTLLISLFAGTLTFFLKRRPVLLVLSIWIILALQLKLFSDQTKNHQAYVQVQQGVLLSDRLEVLDTIYAKIPANTPFSVSILGTPYGVRTAWSYYFWEYARLHGTLLPAWYGFAANGYIGDEILSHTDTPFPIHVTIYEPEFDVSPYIQDQFTQYQNEHTLLDSQMEVNHHTLQFRHPIVSPQPLKVSSHIP